MPPPQQIGRYRVERRLGSGAFAVVWLAHDDRLEAPVAIKVLADNWATRLDIRERFLSEARLLRQAGSGGVVQVFDVGELPDDRPYFVMEYADAGTVEDLLTAGPLPLPEALRIATGAAQGVASLHAEGIVHRDIKPSNVLLKSGGRRGGDERVLVADLGLAKNLARASGLTVVAGSNGYMAPEQSDPPPEGIDVRADVYGLGALLHHLLTGTVPGPPGRVLPPQELLPGIPEAVSAAVMKAMAPDREQRWASATEFVSALEAAPTGDAADAGHTPSWSAPAEYAAPSPVPTEVSSPVPRPAPSPVPSPLPTPTPVPTPVPSPAPSLEPVVAAPEAAPGSTSAAGRPRRRRRALTATAVVLVLAAAGTAVALRVTGGDDGGGGGSTTAHVADATGTVTVDVPADWAKEAADGGWNPSALGLSGKKAAGLTVAQRVSDWSDLSARVNGVFVGRGGTSDSALKKAVTGVRHGGCGTEHDRDPGGTRWDGVIRTWDSCEGGALSEVALLPARDAAASAGPAYVQIRCTEGKTRCAELTDEVLSSVRIG